MAFLDPNGVVSQSGNWSGAYTDIDDATRQPTAPNTADGCGITVPEEGSNQDFRMSMSNSGASTTQIIVWIYGRTTSAFGSVRVSIDTGSGLAAFQIVLQGSATGWYSATFNGSWTSGQVDALEVVLRGQYDGGPGNFTGDVYAMYVEVAAAPDTAPDAPTGLTATATGNAIALSWTAPVSDGGQAITGYRIQRRSPSGSGGWSTIVSDTGTTGTTYNNTGLSYETNYGYQVAAINSVGVGAYTAEANDTTDAEPTAPEITVSDGVTALTDGVSEVAMGTVTIGATADKTITIGNTGDGNLTLSGTPKVALSGTHAAEFSITSQPSSPVVPAGSTTFTIRLTPASAGAKTATVSIANDDADENPFTFDLTATAEEPAAGGGRSLVRGLPIFLRSPLR